MISSTTSTERVTTILVLDDGVTWSPADGASICLITENEMKDLEEGNSLVSNLNPIMEIGLKDWNDIDRHYEIKEIIH